MRPVDKTNLEEFLRDGDASLKCIHITEDGATPQWFISIAGQQHRSCDFAEARCTDGALLHLFEATTTEHFPIVIVVTRNPKVAIKWQGFKGAVVRRMNVGGSTVFLVRTRNESGWAGGTEAVREFILEACTTATSVAQPHPSFAPYLPPSLPISFSATPSSLHTPSPPPPALPLWGRKLSSSSSPLVHSLSPPPPYIQHPRGLAS